MPGWIEGITAKCEGLQKPTVIAKMAVPVEIFKWVDFGKILGQAGREMLEGQVEICPIQIAGKDF